MNKTKEVKHDKHLGHTSCLFCAKQMYHCGLCQATHLKECEKVEYNKKDEDESKTYK